MRTLLVVLALALASGGADAAPSGRGSALRFFGWSQDSRLVAYTRERIGRARPDQRMHRFVRDGAFDGFGKAVNGDVEAYARAHGYVVSAAMRRGVSETGCDFVVGTDVLTLEVTVGKSQGWRLRRGDVVLAEHTYDRIYVGFDAQLYPSPDGAQAVMVMHLDTGWEIDAAIFPLRIAAEH